MKRILMICTNSKPGAWLQEIVHPCEVFESHGFGVDFASPLGGMVPLDGINADDQCKAWIASADRMKMMRESFRLKLMPVREYAAVFLTGGHGTMFDFDVDGVVHRAVIVASGNGVIVGAVCHGVCGLLGCDIISDVPVTGFSDVEEAAVGMAEKMPFSLEQRLRQEARYVCAAPWKPLVVTDGKLVTGQNPASAWLVAEVVMSLVVDRTIAT